MPPLFLNSIWPQLLGPEPQERTPFLIAQENKPGLLQGTFRCLEEALWKVLGLSSYLAFHQTQLPALLSQVSHQHLSRQTGHIPPHMFLFCVSISLHLYPHAHTTRVRPYLTLRLKTEIAMGKLDQCRR